MTATNHVLTGAVFAAATAPRWPLWAILPLAFLLHFALDSLPHFGERNDTKASLTRLKRMLPFDAGIAASILLIIFITQPAHWFLLVLSGVLCASPDLWSVTRFIRFLKHGETRINNDWFARFHHKIQWGERLWGAWIELAWFITFGTVLFTKL